MRLFLEIWLSVMFLLVVAKGYCVFCMLCCMERLAWYDNPESMNRMHGSYAKWKEKRQHWLGIPVSKKIFEAEQ